MTTAARSHTKESVLEAYRQFRGPGEAWYRLIEAGCPPKRLEYLVEKLENLGFLEIGVSTKYAWLVVD